MTASMTETLMGVLGGLGLFLLGMAIMTDRLKFFAGETLRRSLARFTHSPYSGAATGAISTAILQSSSATTVMAVGFAGAGLLTFTQAHRYRLWRKHRNDGHLLVGRAARIQA